MAAIATTGLTKEYGSLRAVDGLDLSIDRGEVYGFLGPNGAGKSTTINMLLDLATPTSGSAEVLGLDCQRESTAIRERVGVLPEGFALYDRLTGRQHLAFAIRAKDVDDDVDRVLETVGLDQSAGDRAVGGYSKGMRQRLALGMALTGDPELLILDEPSTGLDPTGIAEVQELVRSLAEQDVAVFFSSHILPEVEAVCDRVGILAEGELVAEGTLDALRAEFAGDDTLVLTVDDVPADGVGAVETVDGVTDVTVRDGVVRVTCARSAAKARAIERLEATGPTVVDITVEEGSLGDVFSQLITDRDVGAAADA